jgi:hypothetical protein
MRLQPLAIALICLLPVACDQSSEPATSPASGAAQTAAADVHRVECGCALEEVGHCGNYIEIDGAFVEVGGDLGLGKMEWCGQTGLHAKAQGELVGGKFVATELAIVP